jgi:hypothetical protein
MNLPNQALKLIEQELVTILTYGTQFDKARVLYLYAKCQVASVSHLDEESRKPGKLIFLYIESLSAFYARTS